ncbi:MAG: type III secretion system outer membrane ring subunit SctC [Rhizobacter sp.]|nr:type III secretion system outer membrane ring subunit SctC [Rhizobacter sp.]
MTARPVFQASTLRRRALGLAVLMLVLWLVQAHTAAVAAEVRWKGRTLNIVANDKPLADFLREVVASQGITAVVDPKVSGVISGKFTMQPQNILDSLCTTYGLTWFYDGAFLYIDPASEARSEVLPLSGGSQANVMQMLGKLRIVDPRFPIVASERDGGLVVTGPRRYVDMVRQAVKLADQKAALADYAEVRLFPLKYAWASDVRVNRSGKETVVPGVTNVLRSLYGRKRPGGGTESRSTSSPLHMGPARQIRMSSGETINAPKIEVGTAAPGITPVEDSSFSDFTPSHELPQFHADTRMNAVLVRDVPDRMAQYERLIEAMDSRPRLVEIEVTIMDISSDTLDALGVDWRLHGRHADAQIGYGDNRALTWANASTESGQTGSTTPVGGVFTAAIGNELRNFLLARVSALTKTGTANFVARPKVLTLNNTEAVLENLNELHIRVDGFQDAGLFSITAGTSLRVTPLIVDESDRRSLMMSIDIADGDLAAATVDNIPVIRRRTVNTQAMVDEGTSLLIAGFSSEETVDAVTGVPLLSSVPIIGNLFKYSEKTRANMERFYLLTPRLVMPAVAQAETPTGG